MHRLGGQTAPISGGDVGVGGATAERFAARALKRLTALFVSLLLAACATPVAVLAPVAQGTVPPNASQVSMLIATSRQPSGDPGTLFSGERGRQLSLAAVDVSIPPDTTRQSGTVQWPKRLPPDPRKDFAVTRVEAMSVPQVREWLHKDSHQGRVLVFIHGFNNRFADAVFRFAQIAHDFPCKRCADPFHLAVARQRVRLCLRQGECELFPHCLGTRAQGACLRP